MTTSTADIARSSVLESLLERMMDTSRSGDVRIRWTDGAGGLPPVDPPSGWDGSMERMLVQSACLGDERALEALCRKEWFGVYRLVSASVSDVAEAEELTQEIFTRAIASLPRFRYVGVPFRSYLTQIARNLLRDRWRQARACPIMEDEMPDRPTSEPEPEAIVLAVDERYLLLAALGRLPHRWREVLYLRILKGRTAAEIGVEWGRSPESVRQIQHRALLALRTEMVGGGTW